jgi:hypothetical protein
MLYAIIQEILYFDNTYISQNHYIHLISNTRIFLLKIQNQNIGNCNCGTWNVLEVTNT